MPIRPIGYPSLHFKNNARYYNFTNNIPKYSECFITFIVQDPILHSTMIQAGILKASAERTELFT